METKLIRGNRYIIFCDTFFDDMEFKCNTYCAEDGEKVKNYVFVSYRLGVINNVFDNYAYTEVVSRDEIINSYEEGMKFIDEVILPETINNINKASFNDRLLYSLCRVIKNSSDYTNNIKMFNEFYRSQLEQSLISALKNRDEHNETLKKWEKYFKQKPSL